jgi:cellulose synthase/poly-beta-1,6-N-acetylglucosamine synthase-like glycosyltransferase
MRTSADPPETSHVDLTLLVCTVGRPTLAATLESVGQLGVPPGASIETVVVDNGGGAPVADAVALFKRSWPGHDVRLLTELRPGVAYARKRGLAMARGEVVALVDDDCTLAADWALHALSFAAAHPRAGAFGGRNELRWERDPTPLASAYGESLARQDWGETAFRLPDGGTRCPCGAGLVVRSAAVLEAGWLERGLLPGRHGNRAAAGEDTELALMVRAAGWEVWYAPALRLDHVIPTERTRLRHLLWLHYGFGRAEIYLRLLARGQAVDRRAQWRGLGWALAEVPPILRRFPSGFLRYRAERPTWLIRLVWAAGCVIGACVLLLQAPTAQTHSRRGPGLRARAWRTALRRG